MKKYLLLVLILSLTLSSCGGKDLRGKLIWHGNLSSNNVYLTFDDGPNPNSTPMVLDILKRNNVKATFFLLGERAKSYPAIVKRIKREGHEIGNHTYTHSDGYNINDAKILREIKDSHDTVKNITGSSPRYFRPPFGFFNYRYFKEAEKLGYITVLWTFDVGDWGDIKAEELEKKTLSKVKGGSIILLHDGGKGREEIIKALPNIIIGLKRKGFEIRTLNEIN